MITFLIGLIVGGIFALMINKIIDFRQQISRLKNDNAELKKELKAKINRNTDDIFLLKEAVKPIPDQMLQCLEWLGEITNIRSQEDFISTYAATQRFRDKYGFKDFKDEK